MILKTSFSYEKSWGGGENTTFSGHECNPLPLSFTHPRERNSELEPKQSDFFNLQEKPITVPKCFDPNLKAQGTAFCLSFLLLRISNSFNGSFERQITTSVEETLSFPRENEDFRGFFSFAI